MAKPYFYLFTWYVFEASSLTLREEHRLRVFEDRVLRRIFAPRWEEVAGGWRRLCNRILQLKQISLG
jgi:hypothetical protein